MFFLSSILSLFFLNSPQVRQFHQTFTAKMMTIRPNGYWSVIYCYFNHAWGNLCDFYMCCNNGHFTLNSLKNVSGKLMIMLALHEFVHEESGSSSLILRHNMSFWHKHPLALRKHRSLLKIQDICTLNPVLWKTILKSNTHRTSSTAVWRALILTVYFLPTNIFSMADFISVLRTK